MKNGAIIKTIIDIGEKIFGRDRRIRPVQFQSDVAVIGGEYDTWVVVTHTIASI